MLPSILTSWCWNVLCKLLDSIQLSPRHTAILLQFRNQIPAECEVKVVPGKIMKECKVALIEYDDACCVWDTIDFYNLIMNVRGEDSSNEFLILALMLLLPIKQLTWHRLTIDLISLITDNIFSSITRFITGLLLVAVLRCLSWSDDQKYYREEECDLDTISQIYQTHTHTHIPGQHQLLSPPSHHPLVDHTIRYMINSIHLMLKKNP